jgi:hypothetical protein
VTSPARRRPARAPTGPLPLRGGAQTKTAPQGPQCVSPLAQAGDVDREGRDRGGELRPRGSREAHALSWTVGWRSARAAGEGRWATSKLSLAGHRLADLRSLVRASLTLDEVSQSSGVRRSRADVAASPATRPSTLDTAALRLCWRHSVRRSGEPRSRWQRCVYARGHRGSSPLMTVAERFRRLRSLSIIRQNRIRERPWRLSAGALPTTLARPEALGTGFAVPGVARNW